MKLLLNDKTRHKVIHHISMMNLEKPFDVIIEEHQDDRTLAMNSTYWMWITEICQHVHDSTGEMYDVESMSEIMKEKLYPLIKCDKKLVIKYHIKVKGEWEERTRYLSTTKLGVKVMGLYMDLLSMYCATKLGLHLTEPSDLGRESYREAMV